MAANNTPESSAPPTSTAPAIPATTSVLGPSSIGAVPASVNINAPVTTPATTSPLSSPAPIRNPSAVVTAAVLANNTQPRPATAASPASAASVGNASTPLPPRANGTDPSTTTGTASTPPAVIAPTATPATAAPAATPTQHTTFITIRLVPSPTCSGIEFAGYLTGLQISAYDRTVYNTSPSLISGENDVQLGSTTGVAAIGQTLTTSTTSGAHPRESLTPSIIQEYAFDDHGFPIIIDGQPILGSVATAVIVVNIDPTTVPDPHPEYPNDSSYDLRIKVTRNGFVLPTPAIEYNVVATTVPFGTLATSQPAYMGNLGADPPSMYYILPAPPPATAKADINLTLDPGGQPPNFDDLRKAIDKVLAKDSPPTARSLASQQIPLTAAQCAEIASEIVYNRDILPLPPPVPKYPPPPTPPNAEKGTRPLLANLYTAPNSDMDNLRQKFEAALTSYHATNDATATKLAVFVYAASIAVDSEQRSAQASSAGFTFPVDPSIATNNATVDVVLTAPASSSPSPPQFSPSFVVPAAYFYALGASFQTQLTPAQRYQAVVTTTQAHMASTVALALTNMVLNTQETTVSAPTAVTIDASQAIRRLNALAAAVSNSPDPRIPCTGPVQNLVRNWLTTEDTNTDPTNLTAFDTQFWTESVFDSSDYLNLLLQVITAGNQNLVNAIMGVSPDANILNITKASNLKAVTNADWLNFFSNGKYFDVNSTSPNPPAQPNSQLLPPYTLPGSLTQQVQAFITYIQKLFTVGFLATPTGSGPGGPTPAFGSDGITEVLEAFMNSYASTAGTVTFSFANMIDSTQAATVAQNLLPDDPKTQNWVVNAVMCISALYQMTTTVSTTNQQLQFSCMEALYARGFTSAASVLALQEPQFQMALTGTVAWQYYSAIYTAAGTAKNPVDNSPGDGFQPVNDGTLVDCIPPCNLSPFGPVEYLHELLRLTAGTDTLGKMLSTRRGPVGNLLASMGNVDTQVPQIDLVLESLESIGGTLTNPFGAVNNTNDTTVVGFNLGKGPDKIDPDVFFSAVPEYSNPTVQTTTPGVYTTLGTTFTSPDLPYSQSLDICRSYASKLGTTRFELMRNFRHDITEFALDPLQKPPSFQTYLWRLPVALNLALEYLQISEAEYSTLFSGSISTTLLQQLYGFIDPTVIADGITVPWFIGATGLTYCEFLDLWKSGFVAFGRQISDDRFDELRDRSVETTRDQASDTDFPDCLPCCPQSLLINFGGNRESVGERPVGNTTQSLARLIIFIRLWKKLQLGCHHRISFARLADICSILGLFTSLSDTFHVNPDFIRQLAALLMLQERFCLPWTEGKNTSTVVGVQRTNLLGIWVGPTAAPAEYKWALSTLLSHLHIYAEKHFKCHKRASDSHEISSHDVTELSLLAGFTTAYLWNAKPTCTIRMAEVLAKVWASPFTVSEIVFLFTTKKHIDGEDPFPLTSSEESHDQPLHYPRNRRYNLSALREMLLEARVGEDCKSWTWYRIETVIQSLRLVSATSKGPDPLTSLGEHFFPNMLKNLGHLVSPENRRYSTSLPPKSTTPHLWGAQPCEPFHYSSSVNSDIPKGELWITVPLCDKEVFEKLQNTRQLNTDEIAAVRDLYFAPRAALAPFALLFSNFNHAVEILVQEPSEEKRFKFFRDQVILFHRRCEIIAEHLTAHVHELTGHQEHEKKPEPEVAWRVLRSLTADENFATTAWENDDGKPPTQFDWDPTFSSSAFAAILGLVGTGLFGHYETGSAFSWAEMRGGLATFGHERNEWDIPVPTIIPSLTITPSTAQKKLVTFNNGLAMRDEYGEHLNGAQPFKADWTGKLLIGHGGEYEFCAEEKFKEGCTGTQLLVTLHQGEKNWTIITYGSHKDRKEHGGPIYLHTGAYTLTATFTQTEPKFMNDDDVKKYDTGFEVKYKGPDTRHCLEVVPFSALIQDFKSGPLNVGIQTDGNANQLLQLQYVSTLRDIRRTYQRAFKAILFAHRFHLSAKEIHCDNQSELGYMLQHSARFVGTSYYQATAGSVFQQHQANFDFNFLPVLDPYHSPTQDARADPTPQRQAAMFDWWERTFDYVQLRTEIHDLRNRPIWLMFEEVAIQQPMTANKLVHYLEIEIELAPLVLSYFADPMYQVIPTDLLDERWTIRLWHCGKWIRRLRCSFYTQSWDTALPALWACDDPGIPVGKVTGNQNLTSFVQHSLLDSKDVPRRIKELLSLNNGLRERARHALFAYLCNMNRVALSTTTSGTTVYATNPRDLSDLILQDVETGLSEHTSRIEDAIHAVQNFVHRTRVGLEPSFTPSHSFIIDWEAIYSSFPTWVIWKRRQVYRENWIQWEELQKLEAYEGFKFFQNQLRRDVLTLAGPGRPMWWESPDFSTGSALQALQTKEAASFEIQKESTPEGLTLIGTPLDDGQPSWLAAIPGFQNASSSSGGVTRTAVMARGNEAISSVTGTSKGTLTSTSGNATSTSTGTVPVASPQMKRAIQPTPATAVTSPANALLANTGTSPAVSIDTLEFIPLWIQAAVRLGTRFVRVAAAGQARGIPYDDQLSDLHDHVSDIVASNVVDEYYFWIQRANYYSFSDAKQDATIGARSATDPSTNWTISSDLPDLLQWQSRDMWHLFWTKVRFGEQLDPPRRSDEGVPIDPTQGQTPFLAFQGRGKDSLYFTILAGASSTTDASESGKPSPATGFRYDMVVDGAVLTPPPQTSATTSGTGGSTGSTTGGTGSTTGSIVTGTPTPTGPEPAPPLPLSAFPTFVYFQPGKPLIPSSAFGVSLSVAGVLHLNCKFEQALRWCQFAFNPLARDNTWMQCPKLRSVNNDVEGRVATPPTTTSTGVPTPVNATGNPTTPAGLVVPAEPTTPQPAAVPNSAVGSAEARTTMTREEQPSRNRRDPPCCKSGPVEGGRARARVIMLEYVDILLDWGDHLLARNTPEASEQALVIFNMVDKIMGPRPAEVKAHDYTPTMTVRNFVASPAPLNPKLLQLYDRCSDRRHLVHASANARRLRRGPGYKTTCGNLDLHPENHEGGCADCVDTSTTCFSRCQPYRFTAILPKAYDWVNMTKQLGAELLTAYEKGDAEILSALHTTQDRQILDLGLDVVKNQWRAADWEVQAQDQAMESALTKFRYYTGLQQAGLNAGEVLYVTNIEISTQSRTGSTISEGIAQGMTPVPDLAIGVAGLGPYQATQLPIGTKLAKGFKSAARIMGTVADIASANAGLSETGAGWQRRSAEWQYQIDLATVEIQQVKRQQLAAWRRRAIALKQLNNHREQMLHSEEVQSFLRDKFTQVKLYFFLQQETAAQFRQVYDIAMKFAKEVQEALRFERGNIEQDFLAEQKWDDLHHGLMAGERLELAFRRMERTYMELNCREYELTKAISLRLHFPAAFLQLKACGYCEIEIPEWMYDMDHPGHYMRRIKSLTVTVGCVAGPYTGVHCRLQLLSSRIRFRPLLARCEERCCKDTPSHSSSSSSSSCCCDSSAASDTFAKDRDAAYYSDTRYVATRHASTHAIATSTGQEDGGLFTVNFGDERYLPFEYAGAISRWRIELPPENNTFAMDSLTDFVIHLSFTSREGGPEQRAQANAAAQRHLPGGGIRFFDVRHEFPEAWSVFKMSTPGLQGAAGQRIPLRFARTMFPFIVGRRQVVVSKIHVFIQSGRGSKCASRAKCASVPVTYVGTREEDGEKEECPVEIEFACVRDDECKDLYHGILEAKLGPISGDCYEEFGYLKLEKGVRDLKPRDVYLLCEYHTVDDCCCED